MSAPIAVPRPAYPARDATNTAARSAYPPRAGPEHNTAREEVTKRLIAHASKGTRLHASEWTVPRMSSANQPAASTDDDAVWKQINNMRVMQQYCKSLGEMCSSNQFLMGLPVTSVKGLQWFTPINCPLHTIPTTMRACLEKSMSLYCLHAGTMPMGEACFMVHKTVPCQDKDLTRLLLTMHFPESREYEVEICSTILAQNSALSYQDWRRDFTRWRDRGIYHPLCMAAQHMPNATDWIPEEAAGSQLGIIFGNVLKVLQRPGTEDPHEKLQVRP